MKTNSSENKLEGWPGSFLLLKLFFLLIVIPLLIPILAVFLQALIWRYLLCRIEGVNFMGGFLEAFALSLVLVGGAASINVLISLLADQVKKLRHIPIDKTVKRKLPEVATWEDLYKNMPGFRSLFQQLAVYTIALGGLSILQPLRLHFDGLLPLLLASAVVSASWIIYMTAISVFMFALLLKEQKEKSAAGKAAA
jgi:hypothetical protein